MKKKASKFVTEAARLVFTPFGRMLYGFKYKKYKQIKAPCLVLVNHTMTLDPIFVGSCFSFPINYVASDSLWRHKGISKLLEFLIHPIPKAKSMADLRTVKDIISIINQGGSVCVFPEGNRTFNGVTANMPDAIKKLIKKLRVPVVLLKGRGGHFTDPRWGNHRRKGKGSRPCIDLVRVITPEEQDMYDADAIMDMIKEALDYNAFEDQKALPQRYKGPNLAESIERVLFTCPECKAMDMYSKGAFFGCRRCGLKIEFTEYAEFKPVSGGLPFENIYEWDKWQIQYIRESDFGLIKDGDVITEDASKIFLFDITRWGKRDVISKNGSLALYKDKLAYTYKKGKKEQVFTVFLSDIEVATVQGKKKFQIHTSDGRALLFKPHSPSFSPYKYMVLVYRLKAYAENKEFDFYGI